jgi:hypothetical protein
VPPESAPEPPNTQLQPVATHHISPVPQRQQEKGEKPDFNGKDEEIKKRKAYIWDIALVPRITIYIPVPIPGFKITRLQI